MVLLIISINDAYVTPGRSINKMLKYYCLNNCLYIGLLYLVFFFIKMLIITYKYNLFPILLIETLKLSISVRFYSIHSFIIGEHVIFVQLFFNQTFLSLNIIRKKM